MVPSHELREHAIRDHLPRLLFFFGSPMQVSAAMAILANAMAGHGGVRELYNLTPAEYFIPAYHFIYPEEDYFFRSGTGETSVRSISLCTPPIPPPPPPPTHTLQLHCPNNTLGSSNGAVVSCGSEGTKNVSGL